MKCITPVDAIINAVNPALLIGSEVNVAIHRKGLTHGEVVITTVGNLGVTYVIHTVGPVRNQGRKKWLDEQIKVCDVSSNNTYISTQSTSID